MDKEIILINKIIKETTINASDHGGSYDINEENMIKVIEEWIAFKQLTKQYTIDKILIDEGWEIFQIIPK